MTKLNVTFKEVKYIYIKRYFHTVILINNEVSSHIHHVNKVYNQKN